MFYTFYVTFNGLYAMNNKTASIIASELGKRLKQARLNQNMSQSNVAAQAGVSRKTVVNAEQGNTHFESFIAIMIGLGLTDHLNLFLPKPEVSPLPLAKLKGKKRQRASSPRRINDKHDMQ